MGPSGPKKDTGEKWSVFLYKAALTLSLKSRLNLHILQLDKFKLVQIEKKR